MFVESPVDPSCKIHAVVHGAGAPLLLGFPMLASQREVFGDAGGETLDGYLSRLTDRFRVLLVDYPSIGQSDSIPPTELTADRVAADLLAVADKAGFGRFGYWGYSWGAVVGLQLAARTDRVAALAIGGWPPLGAPYDDVLRGARRQVGAPPASAMAVLREPAQYAQWITFYESLETWSEMALLARMRQPRMVFVGERGDTDVGGEPLLVASVVEAHRNELESLGWQVAVIPDRDFAVCMDPEAVVPVVRPFFEAALSAGPQTSRGVDDDAR